MNAAMVLAQEDYRELEGIVGTRYISVHPSLLDSYTWQPSFTTTSTNWAPYRPLAVVMPDSAEQVQEIVKWCNAQGIGFKAIATGWGRHGACHRERQLQIDLCRMDRILDIDEKNRIAVVEPAVIGAQIQAEAMKRGLTLSISGASAITSPLASLTSTWGVTWHGLSCGHNARNMLGLEWVLPNGDMLRLGSLGTTGAWNHPDGPGPSLRGLVRGVIGSFGGSGVFTKGALKLYHYHGPSKQHITGGVFWDLETEIPWNQKLYLVGFASGARMTDALYKMGEAEVGAIVSKTTPGVVLSIIAPRFADRLAARASGLRSVLNGLKEMFEVVLQASSAENLDYQETALRQIVSGEEGFIFDLGRVPGLGPAFWWGNVRASISPAVYRRSGQFGTAFGADEAWDAQEHAGREGEALKRKWIEKGAIADDLCDGVYTTPYEDGSFAHLEELFEYDPRNPRHMHALLPLSLEFALAAVTSCQGPGIYAHIPAIRTIYNRLQCGYNTWTKKLRRLFDGKNVSDTTFYTDDMALSPCDVEGLDEAEAKELLALSSHGMKEIMEGGE